MKNTMKVPLVKAAGAEKKSFTTPGPEKGCFKRDEAE